MRVLNTQEVKQVSGGTFGLLKLIFGGWGCNTSCNPCGGGYNGGHKGGKRGC